MMNLNLKKLFATLGIAALALTANAVITPADSFAVESTAITAYNDDIKESHFSINATNGETFVNYANLSITPDDGYCYIVSTNGKDPQWYRDNNKKNNEQSIMNFTKSATVKVKCVKGSWASVYDSTYDRTGKVNTKAAATLAKRFASAKVYTYKFNVINTGVSVKMWGEEETVVDGMNVYADYAGIKLGYPGKGINYGELGNVGFYKAKGKLLDADTMKTKKVSTKKYDKKYAKLATQTLYYTLDGSTPTTKSKKVAAGKLKTIKVTNPGLNTLKVMGAKEKKVYTYTFYVDTVTATTVDVPEADLYVISGMVTPQNVNVTGYKYFKTWVGVYKLARMVYDYDASIVLEAGTTMEIPHNYFEGYEVKYANYGVE